jgi:Tfp pilus assembly protein PilF
MLDSLGHWIMRTKATLALLLLVGASGAVVAAPSTEPAARPASTRMADEGFALLAQGQTLPAIDRFEASLAADPSNARALIGMAQAARAQELPGKAARFYRIALSIDPSDLDALEGQGSVFAERGAVERARASLDKLKRACGNPACPPARRLEATIAQAAARPAVVAAATPDAASPAASADPARN